MIHTPVFVLAAVVSLTLGACASLPAPAPTATPSAVFEQGHDSAFTALPPALAQPFMGFWGAVRAKDWKTARDFESPDFKAHFDDTFYSGYHEKAHDITKIQLLSSQIEAEKALIQMRVHYRNPENNRETEYTFWDQWVLGQEAWHHILKDPLLRQHAQGVIDHAKAQAETQKKAVD